MLIYITYKERVCLIMPATHGLSLRMHSCVQTYCALATPVPHNCNLYAIFPKTFLVQYSLTVTTIAIMTSVGVFVCLQFSWKPQLKGTSLHTKMLFPFFHCFSANCCNIFRLKPFYKGVFVNTNQLTSQPTDKPSQSGRQ